MLTTNNLTQSSSAEQRSLNNEQFTKLFIEESKKHSVIYGAIKALQYYVETSTSKTCQGLMKEMEPACNHLY